MRDWIEKIEKKRSSEKKLEHKENKKPVCLRLVGYDSTHEEMKKATNLRTYQPYSILPNHCNTEKRAEKIPEFNRRETVFLKMNLNSYTPQKRNKKTRNSEEWGIEDSGGLKKMGICVDNLPRGMNSVCSSPVNDFCKTNVDNLLNDLLIGEKLIYEETKNIIEDIVLRTNIDINTSLQCIANVNSLINNYLKKYENIDPKSFEDSKEQKVLSCVMSIAFNTATLIERIQKEISKIKSLHTPRLISFYFFKHGLICDSFDELEGNILEFNFKKHGENYENNPFSNKCYKLDYVFCNENNIYLLWKQNYKQDNAQSKSIKKNDFIVKETIPISNNILSSIRYEVIFSDYFLFFSTLFKKVCEATISVSNLLSNVLDRIKNTKTSPERFNRIKYLLAAVVSLTGHQLSEDFIWKASTGTSFVALFYSLSKSLGIENMIPVEFTDNVDFSIKTQCLWHLVEMALDIDSIKFERSDSLFNEEDFQTAIDTYQTQMEIVPKDGDSLLYLFIPISHSFVKNRTKKEEPKKDLQK